MASIPTKRLLVYVAAGAIVLGVGTAATLAMRSGESARGAAGDSAIKISASGVDDGTTGAIGGVVGDNGGGLASGSSPSSTSTSEAPLLFVQVAGGVRVPGVYQLPVGSRVFQAVEKAGGFTLDADQEAMTLAAVLSDGCRVYVPRAGETAEGTVTSPEASVTDGVQGGAGSSADGLVSINSAGVEELDDLPGIGPAIAQDIVTYRETNGPFSSIEELVDVPGIGPSRLDRLRPLVTL